MTYLFRVSVCLIDMKIELISAIEVFTTMFTIVKKGPGKVNGFYMIPGMDLLATNFTTYDTLELRLLSFV